MPLKRPAALCLLALAACSSSGSTPAPTATAESPAAPSVTASTSGSASASPASASPPARDAGPPTWSDAELEWRADGQRLYLGSRDRSLILTVPSGTSFTLARGGPAPVSAAFSRSGAMLAVGHDNALVSLHDTATGAHLADLQGSGDYPTIFDLAFSRDDKLLGLARANVELWDVASRKRLCSVDTSNMTTIVFSPDGKSFAGTGSHIYGAWDTATCAALDQGDLQTGGTFPSVLSDDGAFVATAEDAGHALNVYATRPFRRRASLPGASSCLDHVGSIRFTPTGALLSGGGGHWLRTYEPKTFRARASWKAAPQPPPSNYATFDDGLRAALAPEGGPISIVELKSRKVLVEITVPQLVTLSVAPGGAHLATVTNDAVTLWDTATGKEVQSVRP